MTKKRGGVSKKHIVKMIKMKKKRIDQLLLLPNKENKRKQLETQLLKVWSKDELVHR